MQWSVAVVKSLDGWRRIVSDYAWLACVWIVGSVRRLCGGGLWLGVHIHDSNIADQVDHEVDHTFVYKIRGFDCVIHLIHLGI